MLVTNQVLAYPSTNPGHQYVLDTDASNVCIGAVLPQNTDSFEKVIAYASKTLSSSQSSRRYCTTHCELLAVVIFAQHFNHYLLGIPFVIHRTILTITLNTLRGWLDAGLLLWEALITP